MIYFANEVPERRVNVLRRGTDRLELPMQGHRTCSSPDCNKPVRGLGLCSTHWAYQHARKPGVRDRINARQKALRALTARPYDPDLPGEEWRPVAGYEGVYEVSSAARVRRIAALHGTYAGRVVGTPLNNQGYQRANLFRDGHGKWHFVHRLVAAAFIGPCPAGMEVNHKDKNRANPLPDNLEYVTHAENEHHSLRGGKVNASGEGKPHKLTAADALAIFASKELGTVLARRYGVHHSTIQAIRKGKKWRAVTGAV